MRRLGATAWVALAAWGCPGGTAQGPPSTSAGAPQAVEAKPATGAVGEALRLLGEGRFDEALAHLDADSGDPEQLAVLGAIWAGKAASAPAPTPPPLPSPTPKRATPPPAPEFKAEELTAVAFLERALQAKPDEPRASLALAELLSAHAVRAFDLARASSGKKGRGKGPETPVPGPDYSLERVLGAFRSAAAGPQVGVAAVDRLLEFALRVERYDDAEWALGEIVKREREKPEPLVRYGDFLRDRRRQPHQAIERYREALMWRPDDQEVLNRIADIYISEAIASFDLNQWSVAQARLQEAQKYVKSPDSPQGLRLRDYLSRLAAIRAR